MSQDYKQRVQKVQNPRDESEFGIFQGMPKRWDRIRATQGKSYKPW